MSFKIDQGLFNLDFVDYHAILGIPVDAELKDIRKRYLTIARRLHPDSCVTEKPDDRQRASELLSKLVNPAYEKLSQERSYQDYCLLLKLKGQQALKQQETVSLTSDPALRLAAASDIDQAYKAAIRELSDRQYQALDKAIDWIGQLSELNLVYLMRREGQGHAVGATSPAKSSAAPSTAAPATRAASPASSLVTTAAAASPRESVVVAYLRRAQEFETKRDYPKAIVELRDALRIEPQSSDCHSRLGMVYLKVNQPKMAKIHFEQALKLNPQDAVALEGKRKVEAPSSTKTAKPEAKGSKPTSPGGSSAAKGSGGLFGLFGSKKK